MSELIRMPLEDGGELLIESADATGARPVGGREHIRQVTNTLRGAMAGIRSASGEMLGQLRELSPRPTTVTVQFGMKITGEAGVFGIAKTGGDANFKVTLEWSSTPGTNPREGEDGDDGTDGGGD